MSTSPPRVYQSQTTKTARPGGSVNTDDEPSPKKSKFGEEDQLYEAVAESNGFTIFPATLGADEFTIHHKDIVNLLPNDVGLEVAPTMVLWTIIKTIETHNASRIDIGIIDHTYFDYIKGPRTKTGGGPIPPLAFDLFAKDLVVIVCKEEEDDHVFSYNHFSLALLINPKILIKKPRKISIDCRVNPTRAFDLDRAWLLHLESDRKRTPVWFFEILYTWIRCTARDQFKTDGLSGGRPHPFIKAVELPGQEETSSSSFYPAFYLETLLKSPAEVLSHMFKPGVQKADPGEEEWPGRSEWCAEINKVWRADERGGLWAYWTKRFEEEVLKRAQI